ncbi:MAG: hypothetical protein MJE68_05230 [Proteobacteria bacterium]|nr:hypothetical protein [Pseudomonadota bacterium]
MSNSKPGVSFLPIGCARMRDLAIFVPTTTTITDGQTDCFTPCTCVRGKNMQV